MPRVMLEYLCRCRSMSLDGNQPMHYCREAQLLEKATDGHQRNAADPAWKELDEHYDREMNPPVKMLIGGKWVDYTREAWDAARRGKQKAVR